jgi:hypothetical protein
MIGAWPAWLGVITFGLMLPINSHTCVSAGKPPRAIPLPTIAKTRSIVASEKLVPAVRRWGLYENSRNSCENRDMRTSPREKMGFIDENSRNPSENHDMRASPRTCGEKMGLTDETNRHSSEKHDMRTSPRTLLFCAATPTRDDAFYINENSRNSSENHVLHERPQPPSARRGLQSSGPEPAPPEGLAQCV